MSTDGQVTHQGVTHPQPASPEVAPTTGPAPRQARTDTPPTAPRSTARRRPAITMPPPQVIAAIVLAVAALELLVWQVGGLTWGLWVHAVLALLLAVVIAVVTARTRRRAKGARRPAGAPSGPKGPGPRSEKRGLFDRLRRPNGPGARPRKPKGPGSGPRGLLDRLRRPKGPGPAPRGPKGPGSGPGKRGLFDWLRKPNGPGSGPRKPQGPGTGPRKPKGPGAGPRKPNPPRGPAPKARPTQGPLRDFLSGLRDASRKPSPGPAAPARKPDPKPTAAADTKPAQEEKPQPPTKEQLVKEAVQKAVQKAADVTPAPARKTSTGGAKMGDMNRVRAAADEFAAALKEYDPETMHQLFREMPGFEESLNSVSAGIRHVAARAESEWPLAQPVVEALHSMAADVKAGASTAADARGTLRSQNETDIERGVAPRHGSREIESKWDVGRAE